MEFSVNDGITQNSNKNIHRRISIVARGLPSESESELFTGNKSERQSLNTMNETVKNGLEDLLCHYF